MDETDCKCSTFSIVDGGLVCTACKRPSSSAKWPVNVYGKAIEASEIENKARAFPPESKRMKGAR